jgi:hypothetical protein
MEEWTLLPMTARVVGPCWTGTPDMNVVGADGAEIEKR